MNASAFVQLLGPKFSFQIRMLPPELGSNESELLREKKLDFELRKRDSEHFEQELELRKQELELRKRDSERFEQELELRKRDSERLERDSERLERDSERLERDRMLGMERKKVYIIYEGTDVEEPVSLSRAIFSNWCSDNKSLKNLNREVVLDFEDVDPGDSYFLEMKIVKTNFEGYAESEATIQTDDCVKCILNGELFFPPFNEEGTVVEFEYAIFFQADNKTAVNKFLSPVKPDAVLIHGSEWLVLECKHAFTNKDLIIYQAKCEFIERNKDKKWVRRNYPVPTKITYVACSVKKNSKTQLNNPRIIKVVREGLTYKKVTS